MTVDELKAAHKHCTANRAEIERSEFCGCFYCQSVFRADEVADWTPMSPTAICPKCPVDSVIGDASGLPVRDPAFLAAMYQYWFGRTVSADEAEKILGSRSSEQ